MKKLIQLFFAFTFLIYFTQASFATHLAGGDIEYENIGLRKWKIKLTVYRFCDGASLCSSMSCSKTMSATPSPQNSSGGLNPNGCSGPPVSLTLNLVKVEDVEKSKVAICGTVSKNGCDNLGQSTPGAYRPSAEKYVFEGTLDMSSPAYVNACSYYDLIFTECCRNSTTNVTGQPGYTIQSTINIHDRGSAALLDNNSPRFNNEAVIVMCANQENIINVGAVDPDGDSLTYEICKSLQSTNTSVSYNSPYNEMIPFPLNKTLPPHNQFPGSAKVVIDTFTGDYSLNPMNNSLFPIPGDFSIRITQWNYNVNQQTGVRTPYISGISMRNLQLYNIPCLGNTPPTFSTNPALPNGKPKLSFSICAGEQICFTITANDTDFKPTNTPPRIDSTRISWNNSIVRPGKVFFGPDYDTTQQRPREDRWKFCWQTDSADGQTLPYYLSVRADDNMCPNPGKTFQTFSIYVIPQTEIRSVKNPLQCGKYNLKLEKRNLSQVISFAKRVVAKKPFDYSFAFGADTIVSANPNPTGTGVKTIINDTQTFSLPGKYLVKYIVDANSCQTILYDTLTVDTLLKVTVNDTFKCKYSSIILSGTFVGGIGPFTHRWYRNTTNNTPVNGPNFQTNLTYTASDTSTVKYIYRVQDFNGCFSSDTLELKVKKLKASDIINTTPDAQCINQNSFKFRKGDSTDFKNYTYTWMLDSITSTDSLLSYSFNSQGNKKITLIVNELNGCSDTLSRIVQVMPKPQISNVINVDDSLQCIRGNKFNFSRVALPSHTYTWLYDNTSSTNSALPLVLSTAGNKTIKLKIQNGSGCIDTATRTVTVTSVPVPANISLITADTQCISGNIFRFTHAFQQGLTYRWNVDGTISTDTVLIYTSQTPGNKTVVLKTMEYGGCIDSTLKTIVIGARPVINNVINVNDSSQCASANSFSFTYSNANNPQLFSHTWLYNGVTTVLTPFVQSGISTGTQKIRLIIKQNKGCVDTAQKTIVINPNPSAGGTLSVNTATQCLKNNRFVFTYTPSGNEQNNAKWNMNNEAAYSTAIASHSFTNSGVKTVSLVLSNIYDCKDSARVTVNVKAMPLPALITGTNNTKIGNTNNYEVTANTAYTYKWNVSNGIFTEGDTSALVKVMWTSVGTGKISVKQNLDGCEDTSELNVSVQPNVGVKEDFDQRMFSIHPNPNNGRFIIELKSPEHNTEVQLFNALGELVYGKDNISSYEEINVSLTPGLYFAVVKSINKTGVQKLIVK